MTKRLAEQPPESVTYIGNYKATERFLTVHGQILLNQFRTFPIEAVRKSTIPAALRALMMTRRHTHILGALPGA